MWANGKLKCIYEIHGLIAALSLAPRSLSLSHSLRMSLLVLFSFFLQIIRRALFNFCSLVFLSFFFLSFCLYNSFFVCCHSQFSSVIFGVLIIESECLLQVFSPFRFVLPVAVALFKICNLFRCCLLPALFLLLFFVSFCPHRSHSFTNTHSHTHTHTRHTAAARTFSFRFKSASESEFVWVFFSLFAQASWIGELPLSHLGFILF